MALSVSTEFLKPTSALLFLLLLHKCLYYTRFIIIIIILYSIEKRHFLFIALLKKFKYKYLYSQFQMHNS